jgi:hypothetical protein
MSTRASQSSRVYFFVLLSTCASGKRSEALLFDFFELNSDIFGDLSVANWCRNCSSRFLPLEVDVFLSDLNASPPPCGTASSSSVYESDTAEAKFLTDTPQLILDPQLLVPPPTPGSGVEANSRKDERRTWRRLVDPAIGILSSDTARINLRGRSLFIVDVAIVTKDGSAKERRKWKNPHEDIVLRPLFISFAVQSSTPVFASVVGSAPSSAGTKTTNTYFRSQDDI